MRCPNCGKEYGPEVTRCPECGVNLVETAGDPNAATEWVELVTVLETPDPSLLLVAKSLLDAEHVPNFAEGTDIQESLGAGRVPEADMPFGPGRLRVHPDDSERARELLASLQPLTEGEEPAV
jgi:hypothetical protein